MNRYFIGCDTQSGKWYVMAVSGAEHHVLGLYSKKTDANAAKYLADRYEDVCFKFPTTRDSVSLEGYISSNLPYAIRNQKGL